MDSTLVPAEECTPVLTVVPTADPEVVCIPGRAVACILVLMAVCTLVRAADFILDQEAVPTPDQEAYFTRDQEVVSSLVRAVVCIRDLTILDI